jgi:hypothetical protein
MRRKLRIGVIDLVSKGPTRALYARVMQANLASIMPQVIAVWCEQEGHDVTFVGYIGYENLVEAVPDNVNLLFIGAFTAAAHLAYALSHLYRSHGAVTVLGGPHARCYTRRTRSSTSTTCWASPTGSSSATFYRTAPRTGPSACTSQRDSSWQRSLGSASAGTSLRRRCRKRPS